MGGPTPETKFLDDNDLEPVEQVLELGSERYFNREISWLGFKIGRAHV